MKINETLIIEHCVAHHICAQAAVEIKQLIDNGATEEAKDLAEMIKVLSNRASDVDAWNADHLQAVTREIILRNKEYFNRKKGALDIQLREENFRDSLAD